MKKFLLVLSLIFINLSLFAATPLWLRDVKISPDGKEILFCYKGDIYKVDAEGGKAQQLTTQESYEAVPVWSNDGKLIAFSSDRKGSGDIFIMSADGGAAKRLTSYSGSEIPMAFSPDGKYLYFSASIQDQASSALFPRSSMTEVYKISVNGGRIEQVLGTPAEMISFDKAGKRFLYQDQKGFENEWRKHHTSSITRDIWLYDTESGKHTNLTKIAGEDRNPVWSSDGDSFYFLSERNGGSMNIYRASVSNPSDIKVVTSFKKHPVRFLSSSKDEKLAFTYDGEIYVSEKGMKPAKVSIDLVNDSDDANVENYNVRSLSEAEVSSDGKQLFFVSRGNVFASSTDYSTTKQITDTPEEECGISVSPDGKTVVYSSERNGHWGLYLAKLEKEDEKSFVYSTKIKEESFIPTKDIDRKWPQFSPDGKEIAFIEDRAKIMVVNLATKKIRQVTDGSQWYDREGHFNFAWSPDGKWISFEFIGNHRDPYADIALVKADGSGKPVNLTQSGYISGEPRWVLDGNAILFTTNRYGMRSHASWGSLDDLMLVFVNQDAYNKFRLSKEDYELLKELEKEQKSAKKDSSDNKKSVDAKKSKGKKSDDKADKKSDKKEDEVEPVNVEIKGIQDRIVRLTPNSSYLSGAILSKDGETLYYLSKFEDGFDLWKMDLRKKDLSLQNKLGISGGDLTLGKDGTIYLISSRSVKKMSGSNLTNISFGTDMKLDKAAEREYMFNNIEQEVAKRIFRTDINGTDWKFYCDAYRKFLPHISNNYDFSEMLSELLGELNVSHTGSGYRPSLSVESTGNLGLLYDMTYHGKGMKVDEILEKGPFDRSSTALKAGSVITEIDGTEIDDKTDFYSLLNGKAGKRVLVTFSGADGKSHDEVVRPVSNGFVSGIMYERWVKQREEDVRKWSNGRLGYVHIESMDDESFRNIYSDILGKFNNCEGIVIDTRFNGGGRLHEDVQILFSGKKYFTQVIRGREACDMPSRRWNKPSIMLQCEANYSNAHGTPWVYRHENIGKLVGAPVPGTMSSVNWITMLDPSLYFGVPVIGYRLPDGSYLENTQLESDVYILNSPEKIVKGEDEQLKMAVETLLKDLK